MRIIFLDCDGVLNSDAFYQEEGDPENGTVNSMQFGVQQLDPKALALLDQIIDATDAKIIMSSSWRHIWGFREIAEMFSDAGFKNDHAVIGQTGNSHNDHRGEEINDWLSLDRERAEVGGEQTTSYIILDDNDEFDTNQHQFFIQTQASVGLTSDDVQKAISILSKG